MLTIVMQPFGKDEGAGIKGFEKKFREKTQNDWHSRHAFVKKAGKYQLVDTEEAEGDGDASVPLGRLSKAQIEKGQVRFILCFACIYECESV